MYAKNGMSNLYCYYLFEKKMKNAFKYSEINA